MALDYLTRWMARNSAASADWSAAEQRVGTVCGFQGERERSHSVWSLGTGESVRKAVVLALREDERESCCWSCWFLNVPDEVSCWRSWRLSKSTRFIVVGV